MRQEGEDCRAFASFGNTTREGRWSSRSSPTTLASPKRSSNLDRTAIGRHGATERAGDIASLVRYGSDGAFRTIRASFVRWRVLATRAHRSRGRRLARSDAWLA